MNQSLWHAAAAHDPAVRRNISDAESTLDVSQLRDGSGFGGRISALYGRSVLIFTDSQLATALALIELDGVARRIVLCPPDLQAHYIPTIVANADVDAVVSEATLGQIRLSGAEHFSVNPREIRRDPIEVIRDRTTEWVLLTSGTTGVPKLVIHTFATLTGAITENKATGRRPVWATFYDIRRYGGLQILLRTIVDAGSLVLSGDHPSSDFLERACLHGVSHISGTPSHWRRALMDPNAAKITPKYIRLSGEVVDQGILNSLRAFYPEASIAHAFASTEAGVAFDVGDGLAGFPADLIGRNGSTVEMEIKDSSLRIRSPRTAFGYLSNRDCLLDQRGFVDTGDLLERRGSRYHFMGRRSGIINVGGLKVHPEEVEAVINRHPSVQMSRVAARRSPITGAVVMAEILVRPQLDQGAVGAEALKREIITACREALPSHKVPAGIRFVSSIDVAASGKLVREVV